MVPVSLHVSVDGANQSEGPDVKLPILVEQGLFDVLLDDVASFVPVDVDILHKVLDLIDVLAHSNPAAPVGVLSGLHDPE